MVRKIIWGGLVVLALIVGYAVSGTADLRNYPSCQTCGANRKACDHGRIVVEFADGTKRADCGLHCLAENLVTQPARQPKRFLVADYGSKRLIAADKAQWVIYDNRNQCRGSTAGMAFADPYDAERFVVRYGGKRTDFDGVLKIAYVEAVARLLPAVR